MNEEDIVKKIKDGSREEFEKLVELYKNRVFSMAYSYTKNYSEAQDLAQDIFVKVYKGINTFKFDSKFSTWLYKVATNVCIDWTKKRRIKFVNDSQTVIENLEDDEKSPQQKILLSEQNKDIYESIKRLPEKYKKVINLYHFANLSYNQISDILEIPVKTVETRLYRGRKKLKDIYCEESKYGGGKYEK